MKASGLVAAVDRYRPHANDGDVRCSRPSSTDSRIDDAGRVGPFQMLSQLRDCPCHRTIGPGPPSACEKFGHSEQIRGRHFAGMYAIECILCGSTAGFRSTLGSSSSFLVYSLSGPDVSSTMTFRRCRRRFPLLGPPLWKAGRGLTPDGHTCLAFSY